MQQSDSLKNKTFQGATTNTKSAIDDHNKYTTYLTGSAPAASNGSHARLKLMVGAPRPHDRSTGRDRQLP